MPDEPALIRQWKLLGMFSARRYGPTIREMAREMNVSEKTIRRDLDLFREVGILLEGTTGDHGRKTWWIVSDRGHPPLTCYSLRTERLSRTIA
jgi:predicted DNA-binding transcriptional regulator YafY